MKLREWMEVNGINDEGLSRRLDGKISRSQVNRIRQGKSRPSVEVARDLERITSIPAANFVMGDAA
jgi:ribosome-binding protein aMBF1 (putative translation factor)